MQAGKGKAARKSNEITATPTRGPSAEVTPRLKVNKREQAQAKKIKQARKKGLEDFFGQGPCVPALSWEGAPIDAVVGQRGDENKAIDWKEGKGTFPPTESSKGLPTVKATMHLQTKEYGEGGQGEGQSKSKKGMKKSSQKGLDDKILRRSKRTKSDDEGSAPGEEWPDGAVVNLEAMKGLLRKKGLSMATPKGPEKKEKRKAKFAEAASKGASQKPEPAMK
jgi:hypothetical protein